jgi:hypothetical protein
MLRVAVGLAALLVAAPMRAEPPTLGDTPPAQSAADASLNPHPWLPTHEYDPDGPFVTIPAKTFGMTAMILVGGAAATVCMPLDLVRGMWRRTGYGSNAEACGASFGDAAAKGSYIAGGAPFWAAKHLVWDGPRYLLFGAPSPTPARPDAG